MTAAKEFRHVSKYTPTFRSKILHARFFSYYQELDKNQYIVEILQKVSSKINTQCVIAAPNYSHQIFQITFEV
jgi:hypothetical protein